MVAMDAAFEVIFKNKTYQVQSASAGGGMIVYLVNGNDFKQLCLHRAKAINGDKFWTSIPEGRQDEAETFGPLIEKFMSKEQLQSAPKQGQYPDNMDEIYSGKICPYCGQPSLLTDSAEIYGTSYGNIYLCRPCQAWVGVHKGTNEALGRLGTRELRAKHREAHSWFDQLSEKKIINELYPTYIAGMSLREKSYLWLAQQLGIKKEYCHIGFFDEMQSQEVIDICQPVVEEFLSRQKVD